MAKPTDYMRRLEAENAALRTQVEELNNRIAQLEMIVYKAALNTRGDGDKVASILENSTRMLRGKDTRITELENTLTEIIKALPVGIIDPTTPWGTSLRTAVEIAYADHLNNNETWPISGVGLAVYVREGDYMNYVEGGVNTTYPGSADQFFEKVLPAIYRLIQNMPLPSDYAGAGDLQFDSDFASHMFRDLTQARFDGQDIFEKHRAIWFEKYRQSEQVEPDALDHEVRDLFYKFITRTFENADKREKKSAAKTVKLNFSQRQILS